MVVRFIVLTQTLLSKDKVRYIDYFFTPPVAFGDSFSGENGKPFAPLGHFP